MRRSVSGILATVALTVVSTLALAQTSFGVGLGANVLVGGSSKQIVLQPVGVEGSVGLNVAASVASVSLEPVK